MQKNYALLLFIKTIQLHNIKLKLTCCALKSIINLYGSYVSTVPMW